MQTQRSPSKSSRLEGKAERMLSILAMGYGLAILNPTGVFATYQPFHVMKLMGQELLWGLMIFTVGLGQMVAYRLRSQKCRLLASWIAMAMWCSMAIMFAAGGIKDVHSFWSWYTGITGPAVITNVIWAYFQGEIQAELRYKRKWTG